MLGGPGSKPAAASPVAFFTPPKPKILVKPLPEDQLVRSVQPSKFWGERKSYFEGGFSGEVTFPGVDFNQTKKTFMDIEIWQHMFEKVNLKFKDKEIRERSISTARSKLETVEAIYESYGITQSDERFRVCVRLKKCDENSRSEVYFEDMEAEFNFFRKGNDVELKLTMKFQRNGYGNWFKDKLMSIFEIMPTALTHALYTAHLAMCHPHAFEARKKFQSNLNCSPLPSANGFSYGVETKCSSITANLSDLYAFLADPKNCAQLHERFTYKGQVEDEEDEIHALSLSFLKSEYLFHHTADKSLNIIRLESEGNFLSGKIKITFHLENNNGLTSVRIEFRHNIKISALSSGADDSATTMSKTIMRHLAERFSGQPVVASEPPVPAAADKTTQYKTPALVP